jgi:anti-sigma factor RsiW
MTTPTVHPDVLRDLAPLYAAGEASAASAALIEAATASDPALAREVEALRRAVRLSAAPPSSDLEARALGEVRRAVRHRSGWLAGAIFCTLLPMTFVVSGGKVSFFLLRDAPAAAIASLLAGAVMWVLFARTTRAIR